MFWLTLALGIIMGLLSRGLIRRCLQRRFSGLLDWHIDVVLIVLLVAVSFISVVKYRQEEAKKAALVHELNELRRIANQTTFARFGDKLRSQIQTNLEQVRRQFDTALPMITISADGGNQNRVKIADEMGDLLRSAGFVAKVRSSQLIGQSREPIGIIYRPQDRELARAVLMAFEPGLRANIGTQEVQNRPGDEIVVLIRGEPKFTPEGIKVFE